MASSRIKADDKRAKILRELIALESNKYCFDCSQRGPTYVNMTIGAYVCTQCSGLLRGLNNPHRVKSVNIATFTPEDMEFLKSRGNDLCRKVWLGLYDRSSSVPEPDPKNSQNLKDFLSKKYDSKRWYVAPTEELYSEARLANQSAFDRVEKAGGRGHGRGAVPNNSSKLIIQQPPRNAPASVPAPVSASKAAGPAKIDAAAFVPAPAAAVPASSAGGTANLLGDLGSDPFGAAAAAGAPSASSSAFPADFSAAFSANPAAAPSPWAASTQPPAPLLPSATAQPAPNPGPAAIPPGTSSSDKYAALAELDGLFGTAPAAPGAPAPAPPAAVFGAQPTAVNWSGAGFGGWSAAAASTSAGVAWGDASSSGGAVFGGGASGGSGGGVNGIQAVSAAAPFGGQHGGPAAAVTSWSNGNPFGGGGPSGAPNKPSANPFMGNPFAGGGAPPQWGAMPQGPTQPSPPGPPAQNGWGMMPQGAPPASHNPFLGLSNQFPAQPPAPSQPFGSAPNTTNPFL